MTVAAIRPGGGLGNHDADDLKNIDIADPPTDSRTKTTTPADRYVGAHPQATRRVSSLPNTPPTRAALEETTVSDSNPNFENADALVGPQELPQNPLLVQRLREECADKESRVLNRMSLAGAALVVGGLGAGLASGGMFGKRALLGRAQERLHSLVLFTEPGEGRSFNLDDLQNRASAISGTAGTQAVSILNQNLQKHQGHLNAAMGEIHQELQKLEASLQDKMQIDQGLAIGLGALGGATFLTGSILLLMRRGKDHYFKQAKRCEPDGLRLQMHETERNRIETHHLDRSVGGRRSSRKRALSFTPGIQRGGFSLGVTLKF